MWSVIKCAVQGLGHKDKDVPCQDKVYNLTKNGVTAIALADGAGSAKFSHYGAELVTTYICEKFCNDFDSIFNDNDGINVKKNMIQWLLEQLAVLSQNKACEIKDLASTLLVVAVKDNQFILVHIGDGIIGYLKGDELKTVHMPKKEGAVNETFFTTSSSALQQMQLIKGPLDTISGFVLMSDGTEASLYDKRKGELAGIIKKLMLMCRTHRCSVLEEVLLASFESVIKKQTMDDCSMIFMYNVAEESSSWIDLSSEELAKLLNVNLHDFKSYYVILDLLTKRSCSLNNMYGYFHINRKDKKESFRRKLKKLQDMQLIAEVKDNVYGIFIN